MTRVISSALLVLAELVLAGIFKPAASAAKVVDVVVVIVVIIVGSEVWAFVEVFTTAKVTTSSMIATVVEISTSTIVAAPAARGISRYTSADSCDLLVLSQVGRHCAYLWKRHQHRFRYPAPRLPFLPQERGHQYHHVRRLMPIYDQRQ